MLWLIFVTATLPTGTPEPSPIIIPVTFRLRLEKFTEQAHHAYRLLRGRLPCAVKPFDLTEQANMPYTHLERLSACSVFCSRVYPATDTGFRTKNRPSTGFQPFSD